MSNINTLNQLISEADQAYKQKILNILDEIVPCIDIESRIEIAKKICWDKHGFMDSDEIILSMIEEHLIIRRWVTFLQFESKRQEKKNKDQKPIIDKSYWGKTCGSHSHECHPVIGYSFHCNTDNWEPESYRDVL